MNENRDSSGHAERIAHAGAGVESPNDDAAGRCGDSPALNIHVEPFGPDQSRIDQAARALLSHPTVLASVADGEHRLLSFALENGGEAADCTGRAHKRVEPCSPDRFVGTVYDYVENRVLEIRGQLYALDPQVPGPVEVRVLGHQPLPSGEEFAAAVAIVKHERDLRERLTSGQIAAYRPMPPFIDRRYPDGRVERTLTVGLRATQEEAPFHEIVAVSMFDRRVLRGIEDVVRPGTRVCEPPPGRDPYIARGGLSGQAWVTVTSGGQTLWRFLAIRPGASSGTNGSGIELKYVDYRGKRVLFHAHVPILNVEYGAGGQAEGCGPTFRDWQNSETPFEANGEAVAPGFLLCPQPARTIIDNDTDAGNFAGVAIYVDGPEVVLVSEMQAGWYRYITEWRLHANGTIRPRFGFAGTENPCTCNLHTHHVYWRLDFDIRTPGHNVIEEFNDPPIVGNSNWHTKQFEIQRQRDGNHKRKWRVRNTISGETYTIVPGAHDGSPTSYGVGDLWVLRYHSGEIDDGQGFTRDPNLSRAHLERFMSPPESVADTDIVVWYAAHYVHDAGVEVGNRVGPDLIPTNW